MTGVGAAASAVATGMTAATTAVGGLVALSVKGFTDYEQLVGGVETLFGAANVSAEEFAKTHNVSLEQAQETLNSYGDSVAETMKNAENAYKTAGLSTNEYMETVTGFSASLISSLGDDSYKAAAYADMAVTDMADNANKMGTNIESIQNAYQGFAKQNYTMLDNLKLGYGGTKEEMQRLLDDAGKIAGVEFDISSFADITDAIHIMQEEMGIAGTTALEAEKTISGSVGMMKSSWENLVVGMSNKNADVSKLIGNFVSSVGTVAENILPVVNTALLGVTQLIEELVPIIMEQLPTLISEFLPQLLESGITIIEAVISGIQESLPTIVETGMKLILMLVDSILTMLPQLLEIGLQIIVEIALGIADALPEMIPTIIEIMLQIVDILIENLPLLVDAAVQIIVALTLGLIEALPELLEKLPEIVQEIVDTLLNSIDLIIEAGITLFIALIENLPAIIAGILKAVPRIIDSIVEGFRSLQDRIKSAGVDLLLKLRDGLLERVSQLTESAKELVDKIKTAILSKVSDMVSIGKDLVAGIWNGISNSYDWIKDKITGWVGNVVTFMKNLFGIKSPSRVMRDQIGVYLGQGIAVGMPIGFDELDPMSQISDSISNGAASLQNDMQMQLNGNIDEIVTSGMTQVININQPVDSPSDVARALRIESKYTLIGGYA